MANPTFFIEDDSVTAREAEVPLASFDNGCNLAGAGPGIGINALGGAVVGTPEQFTLLDQFGNARVGQLGQHIGGPGYSAAGTSNGQEGTLPDAVIRTGTVSLTGDGSLTIAGNCNLNTLALGWQII